MCRGSRAGPFCLTYIFKGFLGQFMTRAASIELIPVADYQNYANWNVSTTNRSSILLRQEKEPPYPSRAFRCCCRLLLFYFTTHVHTLITLLHSSNRAGLMHHGTLLTPALSPLSPFSSRLQSIFASFKHKESCQRVASSTLLFPTRLLLRIHQQPFDLAHVRVVLPVRHLQLPHRLTQVSQSLSWFSDIQQSLGQLRIQIRGSR